MDQSPNSPKSSGNCNIIANFLLSSKIQFGIPYPSLGLLFAITITLLFLYSLVKKRKAIKTLEQLFPGFGQTPPKHLNNPIFEPEVSQPSQHHTTRGRKGKKSQPQSQALQSQSLFGIPSATDFMAQFLKSQNIAPCPSQSNSGGHKDNSLRTHEYSHAGSLRADQPTSQPVEIIDDDTPLECLSEDIEDPLDSGHAVNRPVNYGRANVSLKGQKKQSVLIKQLENEAIANGGAGYIDLIEDSADLILQTPISSLQYSEIRSEVPARKDMIHANFTYEHHPSTQPREDSSVAILSEKKSSVQSQLEIVEEKHYKQLNEERNELNRITFIENFKPPQRPYVRFPRLFVPPDGYDTMTSELQIWQKRLFFDTEDIEQYQKSVNTIIKNHFTENDAYGKPVKKKQLSNLACGILLTINNARWNDIEREWVDDKICAVLRYAEKRVDRRQYPEARNSRFLNMAHVQFLYVFKEIAYQSKRPHFHIMMLFNKYFDTKDLKMFIDDLLTNLADKWNESRVGRSYHPWCFAMET